MSAAGGGPSSSTARATVKRAGTVAAVDSLAGLIPPLFANAEIIEPPEENKCPTIT
jgi:hypothetical protein